MKINYFSIALSSMVAFTNGKYIYIYIYIFKLKLKLKQINYCINYKIY